MNNNSRILTILSIFHCILGGIGIISLVFLLFLSWSIFSDSVNPVLNIIVSLFGLIFSICLFLSGIFILAKKNYYFSLILACIESIFLILPPLAILGLVTVFILTQDSNKILYKLK
ncbi:MAG: hypothetical protein AAGE84_04555 [Cyanobacteria bacterium P01_G01_bin.39]